MVIILHTKKDRPPGRVEPGREQFMVEENIRFTLMTRSQMQVCDHHKNGE